MSCSWAGDRRRLLFYFQLRCLSHIKSDLLVLIFCRFFWRERELIKNRTTDHNRSAIGDLRSGDDTTTSDDRRRRSTRCQIYIFSYFKGTFLDLFSSLPPPSKRSAKRGRVAKFHRVAASVAAAPAAAAAH